MLEYKLKYRTADKVKTIILKKHRNKYLNLNLAGVFICD